MSVVVALSLLHFVWQGLLIGAMAWIAMKIARSASTRYLIGVGAMVLMAAAPVVTSRVLRETVTPTATVTFAPVALAPTAPVSLAPEVAVKETTPVMTTVSASPIAAALATLRAIHVSPTLASWLLSSWLLGVGLLSVRLTLGWWTAHRLTRVSVCQPRLEILSNAERLMGALGITGAVTVLESALVQVPTAMGWLKPVVLLPTQAMTGLSIDQIDALVAHELAHIKRHDYLVNLLQSAIETLLFYHPMVWLISRHVRHERELCCDDMAIAACGDDRLTYASALAELEPLRQLPAPALTANGGSLLTRVKRILGRDEAAVSASRTNWTAGLAVMLCVLVAFATQSVQGRQVVGGVVDGVVGGVKAGISGGVTGGVVGGVVDAVKNAVGGGVTGGVADATTSASIAPADDTTDQQKIDVGQLIRLEVMVTAPAVSQRVMDAQVSSALTQWSNSKDALLRATAESERLKKVSLDSDAAVEDAAKTLPGLSSDSLVVNYLAQIEVLMKDKRKMFAESAFGPSHPKMVAVDADIASVRSQLKGRIVNLIDTSVLNARTAAESENRFRITYEALTSSQGGAAGVPTRSVELSKDYTVQEDGTILVPYAGNVKVQGATIATMQKNVLTALKAKGLRATSVLASVESRATTPESATAIGPFRVGDDVVIETGARFESDWSALYATVPASGSVTVNRVGEVKVDGRMSNVIATEVATALAKQRGGRVPAVDVRFDERSSRNKSKIERREMAAAKPVEEKTEPPAPRPSATPATPVPVDPKAPRQISGYLLSAGDVVRVSVISRGVRPEVFRSDDYTVQPDGTVALPLVPPVAIGGKSSKDAIQAIAGALIGANMFREVAVGVTVMEYHTANVIVQGAVRMPGKMSMSADHLNLSDAIGMAGGLQAIAGAEIQLKRFGTTTWENFKRSDLDQGKLVDVRLQDSDIVNVPVAPRFFVGGEILYPGDYQWEANLSLERALLKAGGVTPVAAINRVEVRRLNPATKKEEAVRLPASADEKMKFVIEPNDVIVVPKRRL